MNLVEDAARRLETKTGGRIRTKLYPGGSQGDERAVIRKLKLRQLDGAAVTAVGMSLVYSGVRVMELPFLFASVDEVDYVRRRMWPYFREKFRERGYYLGPPGDIGWMYLFSQRPLRTLDDLSEMRMWAWQDDPIARALLLAMDMRGVPMGVPDVLPGLQSGRITACYGSPLAAVALQWHAHVSYAISLPVAYGIGGMVYRLEAWENVSEQDRIAQRDVDRRLGMRLLRSVRRDNRRALDAMAKAGISVVEPPEELARTFERRARATWDRLAGSVFTQDELDMVLRFRNEYRARRTAP